MLKPGLIAGSLSLPLLLGGCGIFEGVSSTVENLGIAADKDKGSYSAPLAVPPNYELRPPPARAEKKTTPEPEPEPDAEKKPEALDTEPVTAAKTAEPAKPVPESTTRKAPDAPDTPEARDRRPQPLVIETPDTPKPDAGDTEAETQRRTVPTQRKVEVHREVPAPPPQPSESTGDVQPETRGTETTRPGAPTTGEDELLRRSGVKE